MICTVCNRALNQTQWSNDETLKSCPNCSATNGREHVFFRYPEKFGTTPRRATPQHPEGPQSYCTDCRGDNAADMSHAVLCRDVDNA